MPMQILDEDDMRRIAREEAQRPPFVHQRNCECILGLPRCEYLIAARGKKFPSAKERRLVLARTSDVIAWLELRLQTSRGQASNDSDAETVTLSRVGARRVAP